MNELRCTDLHEPKQTVIVRARSLTAFRCNRGDRNLPDRRADGYKQRYYREDGGKRHNQHSRPKTSGRHDVRWCSAASLVFSSGSRASPLGRMTSHDDSVTISFQNHNASPSTFSVMSSSAFSKRHVGHEDATAADSGAGVAGDRTWPGGRRRKPAAGSSTLSLYGILVKAAVGMVALGILFVIYRALAPIPSATPFQSKPRATAEDPKPARCMIGDINIISHKCSGAPGASPKASLWSSCLALLDAGIAHFDVDAFASNDGVVFVGHPRDEAARVGVEYVEDQSAAALIAGGVLEFTKFIQGVHTRTPAFQLVTLEPKGILAGSWNDIGE